MRNLGFAVLTFAAVSCAQLTVSNAYSQDLKKCMRIGFSGSHGVLVNLCNRHLYVDWTDGNGDHTTAIGPSTALTLGTIYSPFQITAAQLQNDSE